MQMDNAGTGKWGVTERPARGDVITSTPRTVCPVEVGVANKGLERCRL